jgi:UDPglucose--hexose-1-phosphate uridylyltransferase
VAWGEEGRRPNQRGWSVRVVPNAEPLLRIERPLERRAEGLYDAASGTGAHEIVIETPEHRASLAELPPPAAARVLEAWAQRVADLKRDPRIRAIFLFKNQGMAAGADLPGHAHSQVIGLPVTPKALKEVLQGARRHFQVHERCVFCDVLAEEMERAVRTVAVSERFVAFAPYASRHPFETWIVPRRHDPDFESMDAADRSDLGALLVRLLERLERTLPEPAYNLFLYTGPNRVADPKRWKTLADDFHWHIQILPRLGREGGFELGSGFYANRVTPEQAAAALRLET